ncbi:SpaH/EbpB family LPXTG-anchored major pilin [Schaalia cardiffensis]|uniref:SpaH/EbpB family LPXTG-anchored major pilin n=1 Tax=Schaalia cardiffensis TaxID=181487 RepID=UPI0018E778B2|nr:SpaH/EbpB family LPXTG-anchored major pilin [Schaalia cardiffensis]MBJ2329503.1 SpaH/EbpB family LPXTG-anchored major pilin [Schaalia cardiffensis]
MSTTTRERRIVAVLASLVLSLFTLFALSSAAMATTGNDMGNITDTAGTINVYKHANPGGTLNYGNGNEAVAEGELLDGVTFTLYKVKDVDLVNGNTGWEIVGKVTDPAKPVVPALDNQTSPTQVTIGGAPYDLGPGTDKTTGDGGESGLAKFADVHPGLYIVVEKERGWPLPNHSMIVSKAAPFFVVLPIKDAKGAWSYTANVHPKNTVSYGPQKSAEVKNDADGVITWTVEQTLPTFDDTNKLTEFRFSDDLSSAGDTKGTLDSVKVTVNGDDKTGDFTTALVDKVLSITAGNPGGLPSGGKIVATYTTKAFGNGQYENKVNTFINNVDVGWASAAATLGKIIVEKKDAADKGRYLSGAVFKVCVDEDGVEETKDCPAVGTITTEKFLGTGYLDNLKIQKYVLFETAAPAGYTFNPDTPYKADLTTAANNTVTLTIENTKTNVPTLPLTGADGQLLMTIGGVALVLLAGGVFLVARKKRSEK